MRITVTGAKGQLGNELLRQLAKGGSHLGRLPDCYSDASFDGIDVDQLDICDHDAVSAYFAKTRPDVVFHCAAMTHVDGCEDLPEEAFRVNADAPAHIAKECEQIGAKLVCISTDYVFAGNAARPYNEKEANEPESVYGKTKLAGEKNAMLFCSRTFIVRTAWLYGVVGKNFVKTIISKATGNRELKVVDDQIGCPTNAEDLAYSLLVLAATEQYGIYHCTGTGSCSWWAFASRIVALSGLQCDVQPCKTKDYPTKAKRPAYSVLDNSKLESVTGIQMRSWEEALKDYLEKQSKPPMRIAVTGAGGYIGRYVVEALLSDGCHVTAVDIRPFSCKSPAIPVVADIFDPNVDIYELLGKPDALIHLAWQDGFVHNSINHMMNLPKHYLFLKQLLSGGLRHIGIMGTMHEVGYWEGEIGEDTPCKPLSLYGVAKNALRQSFDILLQEYPDAVFQWMRAFYVIGDEASGNSVFSKIILAESEGRESFPFTSGENKYDFINIKCLAARIAATVQQSSVTGIIECCSGKPVALREQVEKFMKEKGLMIKLDYNAYPSRPYDSPGLWGNPEKINQILYSDFPFK